MKESYNTIPEIVTRGVAEKFGEGVTVKKIAEAIWLIVAVEHAEPPIPIGEPIVVKIEEEKPVFIFPPESYKILDKYGE